MKTELGYSPDAPIIKEGQWAHKYASHLFVEEKGRTTTSPARDILDKIPWSSSDPDYPSLEEELLFHNHQAEQDLSLIQVIEEIQVITV